METKISFKKINPFVRFSATQTIGVTAPALCDAEVFASDHRIYFCVEGEGVIYVNNTKYILKPGSILIWRSGLVYKPCPTTSNFTCITVNFDFFETEKTQIEPIPPLGTRLFSKDFNFSIYFLCFDFWFHIFN